MYILSRNELFYLTDNAEITMHPGDLVIVRNGEHNGIVTFEIKAYPEPTFEFCYNGTCSDHANGRAQIRVDPLNDDETMHMAQFTIHNMNEMDNGNVTLRVMQPQREVNFNSSTVMLFLPCKSVPIQYVNVGILWGFLADF